MKPVIAIIPVAAIIAGALAVTAWRTPNPKLGRAYKSAEANRAAEERRSLDDLYVTREFEVAKASYSEFVDAHKSSPDKEVQDEVASARLHIGYIEGKQKDWSAARTTFLEAQREYRGTGAKNYDYGTLPDQARYQAAVCLAADGKTAQAITGFENFIKDHPTSPLVHACWKRLKRLNGGETKPEWDALLQSAITKKEKQNRLDMAQCGPKAIAEILRTQSTSVAMRNSEPPSDNTKDVADVSVAAATDSRGTTLVQMISALKANGYGAKAMELNAKDFYDLKAPAIWLKTDHYVAIIESAYHKFKIYDPMTDTREWIPAPKPTNTEFRATVLILTKN